MNVTKNSSAFIRQTFLDYFFNNGHKYVRSSPVVPFCDPTLSFVNAGMNQFKNILLGKQLADNPKVVNSQKCIRVGGKHNDLSTVGHDTYHHTFFEMLGNWSFGDYFKKDACQMAWNFLTSPPISIPPNQLFVTYFNGDEKLGLPPDLETKEIWLSIGVDKDRVLPFGINDNFWEMGKIGPCGSCTEIHYDYLQTSSSSNLERAKLVNKGYNDIIELWNIVFIQYSRGETGLLKPLAVNHVDTGMGFERFVAILQGSTSNYDTDLFSGIFDTISKFSGAQPYGGKFGASDKDGLDTAYRILADHTRMCAVALADNMFPDQNQKLKRVLRKALMIAETNFKVKNDHELIEEIINRVSDSLSPTYPEIGNSIKKINFIVKNESELIKKLKSSTVKEWQSILKNDNRLSGIFSGVEAVALPAAYNELIYHINSDILEIDETTNKKLINGDIALKLYDTYGLDVELIEDLVSALGCEFYKEDFDNKLAMLKEERMKNKRLFLIENTVIQNYINKLTDSHVPPTEDSFKYCYKKNENNITDNVNDATVSSYIFPDLTVNLQSIILLNNDNNNSNNVFIRGDNVKLKSGDEVVFILNKTNFYTEAGGQINDTGEIIIIDKNTLNIICEADIKNVLKYQGYILHIGKIRELSPNVSSSSTSSSTENNELSVCLNDVKTVLKLNQNKRLNIMRNHTMTHLINAVLHNLLTVTCQRSSYVNDDNLLFDFGIYNEKFNKDHVVTLENTIKQLINLKLPVNRTVVNSNYLLEYHNIILLPGETYPDNKITLIEIESKDDLNFISREPCCGTHVLNTGDIKDFCLVSVKNKGTNTKTIIAVTGDNARIAKKNDEIVTNKITHFDEKLKKINDNLELVDNKLLCEFDTELINFKNELLNKRDEYFSYLVLCDAIESIDNYCKDIKRIARNLLKEQLEIEMKNIVSNLSDNRKYLVYFVKSNSNLDDVSLSKVTRLCPPDLPVMLFSCSPDNVLKARCSIPQNLINCLTARNWIDSVCRTIGATESIIRGQDPKLVCGMKPKKIPENKVNDLINIALAEAEVIAETAFQ